MQFKEAHKRNTILALSGQLSENRVIDYLANTSMMGFTTIQGVTSVLKPLQVMEHSALSCLYNEAFTLGMF